VLKKQGLLQKEIAKEIGRNASVVCRELQRNCNKRIEVQYINYWIGFSIVFFKFDTFIFKYLAL
ncbi:MAG: hypothetical protein ACWIPI_02640, partial [Polaribacter sp.]